MDDLDSKTDTPPAGGPSGSGRLVLAFRVLLFVLASAAALTAFWLSRVHDRASADSRARFGCPMHPDVTSVAAGKCPICGMDLEPIETNVEGHAMRGIEQSSYMNWDVIRRRGTGPDAPSPAWVNGDGSITAVVYDDELHALSADAAAIFYVSGAPSRQFAVRPILESVQAWDLSTSHVQFRVEGTGLGVGPDERPRPADVGRVRLTARGSELHVIEYSAVLEGQDGPYVMVFGPDGRSLSKRTIRIGKTFGGMAFVLSGLIPRDHVLTRSAFFIDAERRLRKESSIEVNR